MLKSNLKGLWIPSEILLNKDLSDKEKIILSMILYLSDNNNSCFASNKYIANIVNVSHERVSKIISSLKNKGYVTVQLKFKNNSKEIEQREIIPIAQSINRYSQKEQEGIEENNQSDSQKQLYPIVKNNKDIINNIKNKNNNKNIFPLSNRFIPYKGDGYDDINWDEYYTN